ncbi:hypothetical protein OIE62_08600 [Streptomyces scopuliridis]|uniref:Uncharacterized protein n=1 Tax=Streptomyces scopuliridis TaxID=452529 RepID=A0ACD4ZSG5_9ACTN|nr:hypothetical protein [Streptomyces scopuliridis]WSC01385.1 hypothetical protein OG835_33220 [Streptomyces scopuliridis]WSC05078.1 hypothetical protein OIE62_08600 [Streptomyces scopuliridis]
MGRCGAVRYGDRCRGFRIVAANARTGSHAGSNSNTHTHTHTHSNARTGTRSNSRTRTLRSSRS